MKTLQALHLNERLYLSYMPLESTTKAFISKQCLLLKSIFRLGMAECELDGNLLWINHQDIFHSNFGFYRDDGVHLSESVNEVW